MGAEMPLPTSLAMTGDRQAIAELFNLRQQPFKVGVAVGLYAFLQGVEVQDQRIRRQPIYDPLTLVHPVAIVELHRPQVGKQQTVGGFAANGEGVHQVRILHRHPLGAYPHGQPVGLGSLSQPSVDGVGMFCAPGHGGD
jgi:hypothetical protein